MGRQRWGSSVPQNLTFGALTIVNLANAGTPFYDDVGRRPKRALTRDIIFPNTAGRQLMVINEGVSNASSEAIMIAGLIIDSSQANIETLLTSIENYMTDSTLILQTLTYAYPNSDGTARAITNMKMNFQATGEPKEYPDGGTTRWKLPFRAVFTRYES